MIDFDNVQSLIDYYHDFTSSHDLANIDLSEFRNIHIGDDAEMASAEHLRELMEKDTCGECLGKFYHQLKMEKSLEKHDSVYAVFCRTVYMVSFGRTGYAPCCRMGHVDIRVQ